MTNFDNWVFDSTDKDKRKQALRNKAKRDEWEKGKKVKVTKHLESPRAVILTFK